MSTMNGIGETTPLPPKRACSEPPRSYSLRLGPQPWCKADVLPSSSSSTTTSNITTTGMTTAESHQQTRIAPSSAAKQSSTRGKSCQAILQAVSSLYRLDDFQREEIGHGFFSDVYKVTHKVTGEVMVLKMNTSSNNRPNVLREVQLLNKLQHPNILRLLGVCVHEGQLHALTEYVNAGSLEQLLAEKTYCLPWSVRVSLAADVGKGMKYLHSKGFMHRDLTSKNILIRDKGSDRVELTAIVADLGLATKIPDPLNENGKQLPVVGSPWWMAPECIHGKRYSEKADIFSYGIILCEIIARIESDPDILPRTKNFGLDYIAFSKMVESSNCPLGFLQMALTCCQFEPKKRLSFIQVVDTLDMLLAQPLDVNNFVESNELKMTTTNTAKMELDKEPLPTGIEVTHEQQSSIDNAVITNSTIKENDSKTITPTKKRAVDPVIIPLTPLAVGQVVSSSDRYYTPYSKNPFQDRFKHYTKLTGCSMENWMYWCDNLPHTSASSLDNITPPPGSPVSFLDTVDEWDYYACCLTPRGSVSLPSSPEINRRELIFNRESSVFSDRTPQSGLDSVLCDCGDDIDSKSDISSDSALELESLLHAHQTKSQNLAIAPSRKLEPLLLEKSALGQMERVFRRFGVSKQHLHGDVAMIDDCCKMSRDSPESLCSADDTSVLSPTSSFSSHGEAPSSADFSMSRAQWERFQQRKRQRERFLELFYRWETKQPAAPANLSVHNAALSRQAVLTASYDYLLYQKSKEACCSNFEGATCAHGSEINCAKTSSYMGKAERRFQELISRYESSSPSFKLTSKLPWTARRTSSLMRTVQMNAKSSSESVTKLMNCDDTKLVSEVITTREEESSSHLLTVSQCSPVVQ